MQKQAEFIGKKVPDAIEEGLKTLGLTMDDVEIKILSSGGLFKKAKIAIIYDDGKTEEEAKREEAEKAAAKQKAREEEEKAREEAAKAREEMAQDEPHWGTAPIKREPTMKHGDKPPRERKPRETGEASQTKKTRETGEASQAKKQRETVDPTPEQVADTQAFLTELLKLMHIEANPEIIVEDGMRINLNTEDARVIGHRGEVLDAMQQLVSNRINTSHGAFVHVSVDGLGYRDRRKETLEGIAERMAQKAVRTRRKVSLDPMNSADRRIIHATLADREDVFTRSEGHDPARRVVIIPKRN